jgi:hypothetical protein
MSLIHTHGRVVIKVDMESKNSWTFQNGQTIRLEREYGNLNNREVKPTNAIVVSAENIPVGCEVLIHHNSTHDTNRIFSFKSEHHDIKYFSIPEADCYAWRDEGGELKPMKDFAFALRVFEPYTGVLENIEPKLLKNILYIRTGKLSGFVCHVLNASDYQIVFQGVNGKEDNVIRLRHSDDEEIEREEIVAIDYGLTEKLNRGELIVGLTTTDAKPLIHHEIKSNTIRE